MNRSSQNFCLNHQGSAGWRTTMVSSILPKLNKYFQMKRAGLWYWPFSQLEILLQFQFRFGMLATDHITLTIFPFEDLSLQKEPGIFCRAFTTDLITELSRFRQFRVINLPVQDPEADASASKLFDSAKTDYFIQGTFRCEKELVRINVQLYNSSTRHMVWDNRTVDNYLKPKN